MSNEVITASEARFNSNARFSFQKKALFFFLSQLHPRESDRFFSIGKKGAIWSISSEPTYSTETQYWFGNADLMLVLDSSFTGLKKEAQLVSIAELKEWQKEQNLLEEKLQKDLTRYENWLRVWRKELALEYVVTSNQQEAFEEYCKEQYLKEEELYLADKSLVFSL